MKGSIYTYYSVSVTPTQDGVFPYKNFTKLKNARKYLNEVLRYFEDKGKKVRVENFQSGQELLDGALYFESYNLEELQNDGKASPLTYVQIRREFLITEDSEEE